MLLVIVTFSDFAFTFTFFSTLFSTIFVFEFVPPSNTVAWLEIVVFTFAVTFTVNVIIASPFFDTGNSIPSFNCPCVISLFIPVAVILPSGSKIVPSGIVSEILTVPSFKPVLVAFILYFIFS